MVALAFDERFLLHRPEGSHPERPDRALAVMDGLRSALGDRAVGLPVRAATREELCRVHEPGYLEELARLVPGRSGFLDADTYFSPGSWEAALLAAGASVDVALGAYRGEHPRGFAVVRPPGHHAEPGRAMGFCLINNVAVAAAAARAEGCSRVAIVDWDVHHGNGTQVMFYRDPTVLFLSVHQFPFYPGTGAPSETGDGEGRGSTINAPLSAGAGDSEYLRVFENVFEPALRSFRPGLVLVSAGFDAHVDDPLAEMRVTPSGFRALAQVIRHVADDVADGKMACVLEGGYDLEGLRASAREVGEVLAAPPGEAARGRHLRQVSGS
ncbi:MAG: histone deacetylase [Deltaproteobacteria bacterium]|nr:histone deacetylase [Deltaproteobacteria bacterium]